MNIVQSPSNLYPISLYNSTLIFSQNQVNNLPSKYRKLKLPPPPFLLIHTDPIDMGKIFPGRISDDDTYIPLKNYSLIESQTTLDDIEDFFYNNLEVVNMLISIVLFVILGVLYQIISKRKGAPKKFEDYIHDYLPIEKIQRKH